MFVGEPLHAGASLSWLSPDLRRLDADRQTLQESLLALPPTPPQVTQRLGWHSEYNTGADAVEWVELSFSHAERLDAVVLIAPPPGSGSVEPGYGFPLRFRVELLGDDEKTKRTIIPDHSRADFPNPGPLSVIIPTLAPRRWKSATTRRTSTSAASMKSCRSAAVA